MNVTIWSHPLAQRETSAAGMTDEVRRSPERDTLSAYFAARVQTVHECENSVGDNRPLPSRSSVRSHNWDFVAIDCTAFIEEFPEWPGDITKLAPVMQNVKDVTLRYAISLSLGCIESPSDDAKREWEGLLSEWGCHLPNGGRIPPRFCIAKWGLALPDIPEDLRSQPSLSTGNSTRYGNSPLIRILSWRGCGLRNRSIEEKGDSNPTGLRLSDER